MSWHKLVFFSWVTKIGSQDGWILTRVSTTLDCARSVGHMQTALGHWDIQLYWHHTSMVNLPPDLLVYEPTDEEMKTTQVLSLRVSSRLTPYACPLQLTHNIDSHVCKSRLAFLTAQHLSVKWSCTKNRDYFHWALFTDGSAWLMLNSQLHP